MSTAETRPAGGRETLAEPGCCPHPQMACPLGCPGWAAADVKRLHARYAAARREQEEALRDIAERDSAANCRAEQECVEIALRARTLTPEAVMASETTEGRILTDEQRAEAVRLWGAGTNLGQIAEAIGCSVYALSPWLYAAGVNETFDSLEADDAR